VFELGVWRKVGDIFIVQDCKIQASDRTNSGKISAEKDLTPERDKKPDMNPIEVVESVWKIALPLAVYSVLPVASVPDRRYSAFHRVRSFGRCVGREPTLELLIREVGDRRSGSRTLSWSERCEMRYEFTTRR
jgi:hypothetical protein